MKTAMKFAQLFSAMVFLAVSSNAATALVTSNVIGAWQVRCEKFSDLPKESCAVTQNALSEENPDVSLGMVIVKTPASEKAFIRIVAPPRVFLPRGVSLKIDQDDVDTIQFSQCHGGGCVADALLDDKTLEQMKNGKIATLVIFMKPEEGLRHLFKLDGFREAISYLR